jgi:ssDNA-specific exonuclease RecJ
MLSIMGFFFGGGDGVEIEKGLITLVVEIPKRNISGSAINQ